MIHNKIYQIYYEFTYNRGNKQNRTKNISAKDFKEALEKLEKYLEECDFFLIDVIEVKILLEDVLV